MWRTIGSGQRTVAARLNATNSCRGGAAATALWSPLAHFGSLYDRVSDIVSDSVSQLAKHQYLDQDKFVTEPRRLLERRHSNDLTLAQRLQEQREVRQVLIPTSITVSKDRLYVHFTWPAEALRAVAKDPASAAAMEASPMTAHKTHALAEYLRAYTPSTDGSYGTAGTVVYGRRGVTITDIIPMGSYAIRIVFSDGHNGGIYPYDYLYTLTCSPNKIKLMRAYLVTLREKKKSREPPRRAPSRRRVAKENTPQASGTAEAAAPTNPQDDYRAPAYGSKAQ